MRRLDERLARVEQLAWMSYQMQGAAFVRALLAEERFADPLRLERFGYQVYSQNDEDGLIAEIFRRIGTTNSIFVEIGVENGLENNTRCLLEQGWRGAWIDGSPSCVAAARTGFARAVADGRLRIHEALVDRDNVNACLEALELPREPDLLGIDIDGNDYHVWEAITVIEPRVVVIEYNARFRPPMDWVMPYDPRHAWDGTHYFGASLEALARLGARKRYRLVGCNITGANAFFVRRGVGEGAFATGDAAYFYHPARYWLTPAFATGHPVGYGGAGDAVVRQPAA